MIAAPRWEMTELETQRQRALEEAGQRMQHKLALIGCSSLIAALAGCGGGEIGLDDPGLWEQVALGRPQPIKMSDETRQAALGFSVERGDRRLWEGESRDELVRALVDADGKVMAKHALRTWRRQQWFGATEEMRRFTLEVQLADANTVTQPPAAKFDEELLAVGKAMALGQAPRTRSPQSWKSVEPVLLARLNEQRKGKGLPPAAKLAVGTAELMVVAEMLLESVSADGGEAMDRAVWGELNLAEAFRRATHRLPRDVDGTFNWSSDERQEDTGFSLALGKLPILQVGENRYRFGGSLTNLGDGRVRVVLHGEWYHGAAED